MNTKVYLQIEKYREVLDAVDVIKSRIVHAREILKELHSIRSHENKTIKLARERLVSMHEGVESMEEEIFIG